MKRVCMLWVAALNIKTLSISLCADLYHKCMHLTIVSQFWRQAWLTLEEALPEGFDDSPYTVGYNWNLALAYSYVLSDQATHFDTPLYFVSDYTKNWPQLCASPILSEQKLNSHCILMLQHSRSSATVTLATGLRNKPICNTPWRGCCHMYSPS